MGDLAYGHGSPQHTISHRVQVLQPSPPSTGQGDLGFLNDEYSKFFKKLYLAIIYSA
ncbi:hypothetical protein ACP70R_024795 [Stipagrostis hirtigluma subsp. patula]